MPTIHSGHANHCRPSPPMKVSTPPDSPLTTQNRLRNQPTTQPCPPPRAPTASSRSTKPPSQPQSIRIAKETAMSAPFQPTASRPPRNQADDPSSRPLAMWVARRPTRFLTPVPDPAPAPRPAGFLAPAPEPAPTHPPDRISSVHSAHANRRHPSQPRMASTPAPLPPTAAHAPRRDQADDPSSSTPDTGEFRRRNRFLALVPSPGSASRRHEPPAPRRRRRRTAQQAAFGPADPAA
jgi:hypothetical protein